MSAWILLPAVMTGMHFSLKLNIYDQSLVFQRIISLAEEVNAYDPFSVKKAYQISAEWPFIYLSSFF